MKSLFVSALVVFSSLNAFASTDTDRELNDVLHGPLTLEVSNPEAQELTTALIEAGAYLRTQTSGNTVLLHTLSCSNGYDMLKGKLFSECSFFQFVQVPGTRLAKTQKIEVHGRKASRLKSALIAAGVQQRNFIEISTLSTKGITCDITGIAIDQINFHCSIQTE